MSAENENEGEFECLVCNDTFDTEENRDEHLAQIHPDYPLPASRHRKQD